MATLATASIYLLGSILGEVVAVSAFKATVIELTNKAILIAFMTFIFEHIVTLLTNNAFLCFCLTLKTVRLKLTTVAGTLEGQIVCQWAYGAVLRLTAGNIRYTGKIFAQAVAFKAS